MFEWRRIFSRKVLVAGVLLFLLQQLLFLSGQLDGTGFWKQLEENRIYYNEVTARKEQSYEELRAEVSLLQKESAGEWTNLLLEKAKYLNSYPQSILDIVDRAKSTASIGLFQTDPYTTDNIRKTAEDFADLAGVVLPLDHDRATEAVLNDIWRVPFVYLFLLYIIYELLRERDGGTWELLHTLPDGRGRLIIRRIFCLCVVCIGYHLILFAGNLACSCLFYGMDDFGGVIQTISDYAKYPRAESKGMYLCRSFLQNTLAALTMTMASWLVFTWLRNRNAAVVVLLGLFAVEWNWMKIPVQSRFALLRYLNLCGLLDLNRLDRVYQNVRLADHAVSANLLVALVGVGLTAGSVIGMIGLYQKQYPGLRTLFLKKWTDPVMRRLRFLAAHLPFAGSDLYKLLVSGKGILILAVGWMICFGALGRTWVTFPEIADEMDQMYQEYGGSDWQRFTDYVDSLREEMTACQEQLAAARSEMKNSESGGILLDQIGMQEQKLQSLNICLTEFTQTQQRYEEVKKRTGIEIYAISSRGYDEVIGSNAYMRACVTGIVLMVTAMVLASRVFLVETASGMKPVIRTSMKGTGFVFLMKLAVYSALCLGNCFITYGWQLHALLKRYPLYSLTAPIQSLDFLADESLGISIHTYMILTCWDQLWIVLFSGSLILWFSSDSGRKNQLYLPAVIKVSAFMYLGIQTVLCGMVTGSAWFILSMALFLPFSVLLLLISSYRNWCGKREVRD